MNRIVQVCAATIILTLTGCQSLLSSDQPAEPNRTAAETLRVDRYYEMLMPGDTALRDVTDDGTNMYLDFREPLPANTKFFDSDGQELVAVSDGALVGVVGLHQGVLIKINGKSSFVSVREGATRETAPLAANTRAIAAMRENLIAQVAASQAMKRALQAVEAREKAAQEAAEKVAADKEAIAQVSQAPIGRVGQSGDATNAASVIGSTGNTVKPERSTDAMLRVFFDFDAYRAELTLMNEALRGELGTSTGLMITGHTDSIGPVGYNLNLGLRRAEFVAKRLASEGVEPGVMTVDSRGETEPIASNDTAEGRAKNRRVELRLAP